jgi:hypothetical protein
MGNWQGDDYRQIPVDGDPTEFGTVQRRAFIFERIQEAGHPALIDKPALADETGISRRQVYYDMEAVSEFIEKQVAGDHHVGQNYSVFEKAKREAIQRNDWEMAIAVLKDEAEWLENRGAINKEPEEIDVTWREYIGGEEDE